MVLAWVDYKLKQHDGFGGLGHVLDGLLERLLRHQSEWVGADDYITAGPIILAEQLWNTSPWIECEILRLNTLLILAVV